MLSYQVILERLDSHGSVVSCKDAEITLDTDVHGRTDAFNPAELLLAALAGCIAKGIERVAPMIGFSFRGLEVRVGGTRQDTPPKLASITYEVLVDTDESERRLELLHENVKKFGTVFNTLAPGTEITGRLVRAQGREQE